MRNSLQKSVLSGHDEILTWCRIFQHLKKMRQWQGGRGPSAAGATTPITVSVLMQVIQFRYYYYYALSGHDDTDELIAAFFSVA